MSYMLEKHEICLLQSINSQIDSMYEENIVIEIRNILLGAIITGEIEKSMIQKLLFLLSQERLRKPMIEEKEELNDDWSEWEDNERERIRNKVFELQQKINEQLTVRNAVHQKRENCKNQKRFHRH